MYNRYNPNNQNEFLAFYGEATSQAAKESKIFSQKNKDKFVYVKPGTTLILDPSTISAEELNKLKPIKVESLRRKVNLEKEKIRKQQNSQHEKRTAQFDQGRGFKIADIVIDESKPVDAIVLSDVSTVTGPFSFFVKKQSLEEHQSLYRHIIDKKHQDNVGDFDVKRSTNFVANKNINNRK